MTDKNSPESNRSSPENGGTSPEKGGISPVAGGRTRRGRLWAWVGGASLAILALLLASGWWLWPLVPPRQTVQPDSPEAWRALMGSESRPVHLAAAILLAGKGDADGTKALLEAFLSLAQHELHTSLAVLLAFADKERLDPALIDAFLNHQQSSNLVPPGKETRHLPALLRMLNQPRLDAESRQPRGVNDAVLWAVVSKIAASGNRKALENCRAVIRKAAMERKPVPNPCPYWDWADFLLTYYADDPVKGFLSIEKEYPEKYVSKVQPWYLQNLGKHRYYKAAVDLWSGPLSDDKPTTSGGFVMDWANIADDRLTPSLRSFLARGIVHAWQEMPQEQKARLSERDRDQFFLAFAQYCESQAYGNADMKPTREMLLRLLQEPGVQAISTIRRLHEQGEKDLRSILIQESLRTRDLKRMREALYALHYWVGGIPKDAAEAARTLMQAPSSGPDDAMWRKDITQFLSEPSPYESKTAPRPPNPPYRDSRIPWALRRNQTGKALAQMRALETALMNYSVDYSSFPPGFAGLTSPIGYINLIPPDVCAGSGTYGYAESRRWGLNYALASAGPDGARDISLAHFMLTRELLGITPGTPGTTPYLRLTPQGYEFLEEFSPGADIVLTLDLALSRNRRYDGSQVRIP